ncbi:hypothetical protein [Streptomyces sp. NPDC046909]|uniref:hypothetical protein n=1 Tax=Streptomyces sp. NPDC046909 TaxID=3155617 RepID=UPI0033CB4A56
MENMHEATDRARLPVATEPGVLVHAGDRQLDVERWLLSSLVREGRDRSRVEWQELGVTVLPLGDHLSAVRIPGALVRAAVQCDEGSAVGARLAERLRGPVIHDPGFDRYYALVPTSAGPVRVPPGTEYLGGGTYLGVPRTDLTALDKGTLASYWSAPITRPGALCALADVCELALLGHILTNEEAES